MIIVTGSILAHADTVEKLLELSLQHVFRSRTESGCRAHAVHRDVENPLRLVFLEQWEGADALAAHFALPASRAFVRAATALAAEAPEMHVFEAEPLKL